MQLGRQQKKAQSYRVLLTPLTYIHVGQARQENPLRLCVFARVSRIPSRVCGIWIQFSLQLISTNSVISLSFRLKSYSCVIY